MEVYNKEMRKLKERFEEKIEGEIWMDVIGFEGMYQVSNIGRVKSLDRPMKSGVQKNCIRSGGLLKQQITQHGYYQAYLSKHGLTKGITVHRLLALAFIPNPSKKRAVNHKDGNKKNNNLSNLEWVTDSENVRHAFRTGLNRVERGENHASSKFSDAQVEELRAFAKKIKRPYAVYGKIFGISKAYAFQLIKNNKRI